MMDSGSVVEMKTLIDKLKKEPKAKLQLSDAGVASVDEAQKAVVVVGGIYKCDGALTGMLLRQADSSSRRTW